MKPSQTKDIELVVPGSPFAVDESLLNEKALILELLSGMLAVVNLTEGKKAS